MTLIFTTSELADMEEAQEAHMMDSCQIGTYAATRDTYGATLHAWTYGSDVACGLDPTGGKERYRPDRTIVYTDATIRLPRGTAVTVKDRVKVTKRFGVTEASQVTYGVVGAVQDGPSGIVLDLEVVS